MITIELSLEQAHVLMELLKGDLSDLRMEIAGTDRLAYREMLRAKKAVVREVIGRLEIETRPRPAELLPRELHPEI